MVGTRYLISSISNGDTNVSLLQTVASLDDHLWIALTLLYFLKFLV